MTCRRWGRGGRGEVGAEEEKKIIMGWGGVGGRGGNNYGVGGGGKVGGGGGAVVGWGDVQGKLTALAGEEGRGEGRWGRRRKKATIMGGEGGEGRGKGGGVGGWRWGEGRGGRVGKNNNGVVRQTLRQEDKMFIFSFSRVEGGGAGTSIGQLERTTTTIRESEPTLEQENIIIFWFEGWRGGGYYFYFF